MPALEYMAPGDRIDAAALDELWAEFERKMGLLLCHKSPLAHANIARGLMIDDPHQTLGACFGFWPASNPLDRVFTRIYDAQCSRYDHQVYADAVDGAVITSYDDDRKIAFCEPLSVDLDRSLACHTFTHEGEIYRLATAADRAQKRYNYAVAEIIVEGEDTIQIRDEWDKYNCFRIHNMDLYDDLVVLFGDHHSCTVENLGCVTIRRDAVAGPYCQSRYFWPYQVNDPSFYRCGLATSRWPERTIEANNVVNPSILFRWVELLTSPDVRTTFGFDLDPEELADMAAWYRTLLADPGMLSSYLLDCIVHKGDLTVIERHADQTCTVHDAAWQGLSKSPEGPLQRSISTDGAVTLTATVTDTADLLCVGTNLLHAAGAQRNVSELPVTIPAALLTLTVSKGLGPESVSSPIYGNTYQIAGGLTTESPQFRPDATIETMAERFSADTITIIDTAIAPTGPTLVTSQPIEWRYPFADPFSLVPPYHDLARVDVSTAGINLVQQHRLGHSWPSDSYGYTLSLPARVERVYAPVIVDGLTQYISDISDDGLIEHEWIALPPPLSGESSEIAIQSSELYFGARNNHHTRPLYTAVLPPDNVARILAIAGDGTNDYQEHRTTLLGAYRSDLDSPPHFLRVPMLAEHWNHMAQLVNSLSHCRPLTIEDLYFSTSTGNLVQFAPNAVGLTTRTGSSTTIRPIDQYANIVPGSLLYSFCEERGITICSSADLPATWAATCDLLVTVNTQTWRAVIERVYGPASYEDSTPPGYRRATSTYRYHFRGIVPHATNLYGNIGFDLRASHDIFCPQSGRWITTDAVRDFAEQIGVAFMFSVTGRAVEIFTAPSGTPAVTAWSTVITPPASFASIWYSPLDPQLAVEFAAIDSTTYDESTYFPAPKMSVRLRDAQSIDTAVFIAGLDLTSAIVDVYESRNVPGLSLQTRLIGPLTTPLVPLVVTDGVPDSIRSVDYSEVRTITTLRVATDSIQDDTVAVCSTNWTAVLEPNYALASRENYDAWRTGGGDFAIPRTILPQDPDAAELSAPAPSAVIFPTVEQRAWSVRVVDQMWVVL
jgi:hypothetical protein